MEKKDLLFSKSVIILVACWVISGCATAAMPLMTAIRAGIVAHSATKTVQMSTDGNVEMSIGENEVTTGKNNLVLSNISKLAIWPNEDLVCVADELQRSGVFALIATPAKTGRALDSSGSGFGRKISDLTYSEKIDAFQTICSKTDTEAIVIFEDLGTKTSANMWSLRRSSSELQRKITIFEVKTNRVIFTSTVEVRVNLGGSTPNEKEVKIKTGRMLAKKIIQLKTGQIVAQR